ncbi:LysR family transcriptional regulator [Burkholderiaceae bacterium FT117]|uniref:LysR family transcriptional regulator n=1 Tax=Zeimonas sediminis TaxID=2944268 RepID=UPI002342C62D|nr:LysR family transcriptional regulator [Zeimonas sediminis]MCM5569929.1 LysR family transcriptional regulator [Zeimonas sediminis]
MRITLRQMEAFRAVARLASFSQAARALHLSQPALSATIRKFEEAIGAKLFDRDTRNVRLTSVGQEVLTVTDSLFDDFDKAMASLRDFLSGRRGRLSVAASPSVAAGFLPPVIAAFRRMHPEVELQFSDVLAESAIGAVKAGQVDLALAPQVSLDADLEFRPVFRDTMVALARADHPLVARRRITWKDLAPYDLIFPNRSSNVRQLIDAACIAQGVALRSGLDVGHASTVMGLAVNGVGVGVLPRSLAALFNDARVTPTTRASPIAGSPGPRSGATSRWSRSAGGRPRRSRRLSSAFAWRTTTAIEPLELPAGWRCPASLLFRNPLSLTARLGARFIHADASRQQAGSLGHRPCACVPEPEEPRGDKTRCDRSRRPPRSRCRCSPWC